MSDISKRLEYVCKACGWRKSILAAWADLKPKKCMNKKCGVSFIKNPDQLMSHYPDETAKEAALQQLSDVGQELEKAAVSESEEKSFKKNKWK